MHKQRMLSLTDEAELDALWEGFPSICRKQLIELWARLLARAARRATTPKTQEAKNDDSSRSPAAPTTPCARPFRLPSHART